MPNLPVTGKGPTAPPTLLDALAKKPESTTPGSGRLIFALDATASRKPTWHHACFVQGSMFEAAAALGGLETQLVFYRGFDECKASKWLSRAADLRRAMRHVKCAAGETQIGRILDHALRTTDTSKINALIFVGDAMEEGIDQLCHRAGQLGARNVPIFMLHEGDDPVAGNAFRQIARLSGGAYLPFDLAALDRLRELLAAVAVYAAGGLAALEQHADGRPAVRLLTSQLTNNRIRGGS